MNKTILTLLILSSLVVLTGCTNTQPTANTVDTPTVVENINTTNDNTNVVENANTDTATDIDTSDLAEGDTEGWETYTNEEYGFSFMYPSDWKIISEEGPFYSLVIDDKKIQSFEFFIGERRILAIYPEGEFDHDRFINSKSVSVKVNGFAAVLSTIGLSQQHIFEDYPTALPGKFRIEAYPKTWSEQVIVNDVLSTLNFE